MFSFFRKKPADAQAAPAGTPSVTLEPASPDRRGTEPPPRQPPPSPRRGWIERLRGGLRKTGSSITQVFSAARIDDALYDELEAALVDGRRRAERDRHLLDDLKRRVRERNAREPAAVRALLEDALADLLLPLERPLEIGRAGCTVMMVVGVNGAGKTTSIGKLACHLAEAQQKVLLAAADTFRAAAREQLAVWAHRVGTARGAVEIVSQQGGDPAAVTYDAVVAGRSRGCDVVIADTAGRLPTQLHLMEELKKVQRVIAKADPQAPHEVLLVVDGNTGQNALAQVRAFDAALGLTGLIVTKLDGTAKGGVLAAIALWARERAASSRGNARWRSTFSASARRWRTCRPSARASSRRRCWAGPVERARSRCAGRRRREGISGAQRHRWPAGRRGRRTTSTTPAPSRCRAPTRRRGPGSLPSRPPATGPSAASR